MRSAQQRRPGRHPPRAWSNHRHWHAKEDEFIYVLSGEVVLATDAGEELLRAGDCAGFKAGDPTGTVSRTAARRPQWCWKLARASRANTRPILIST